MWFINHFPQRIIKSCSLFSNKECFRVYFLQVYNNYGVAKNFQMKHEKENILIRFITSLLDSTVSPHWKSGISLVCNCIALQRYGIANGNCNWVMINQLEYI